EPGTGGPYTVLEAIADYLTWYGTHRKALAPTEAAAQAHILPALGSTEVAKLTTKRLRAWHEGLAKAPARLRSRRGAKQNHRQDATQGDPRRRRQATANRILTVLKAALNHAWREGRVTSDDAWRRVKPFHDVEAPVVRYLTEAECVRVVNACPPDF